MTSLGLLLTVAFAKGPAVAQPPPDVPVQVHCDDMVVEDRRSIARCEGRVVAVRRDVTLRCDHAIAHYDSGGQITELTCRGHVHVVQKGPPARPGAEPAKDRVADGDKGVYDERARTLVLTGDARLQQGNDLLRGEPIVFFVDLDRVEARHAHLRGRARDALGAKADGGTPR